MKSSNIVRATATGDITTASSVLRSVVLTAAAATATVDVRAGGSGGTVILSLSVVANTSVSTGPLDDVLCAGGIHVTVAGAGAIVSVVYA